MTLVRSYHTEFHSSPPKGGIFEIQFSSQSASRKGAVLTGAVTYGLYEKRIQEGLYFHPFVELHRIGRDLKGKVFYICAPLKMAQELVWILRGIGVSEKRIRQEIFSFLD